jgi:hypothetical protein
VSPKSRNGLDYGLHLFGHDQARALELRRRVLKAGAPQKVLVIEPHPQVIPAGIADVTVDHPVGHLEFVGGIVQPLIITTGVPAAQASQDRPLDSPTKNSACVSQ